VPEGLTMKKEAKVVKRRLRSSYFVSIISISLLLFIVGLMGLLILNARNLSEYVKENIGFSVILDEDIKEVDIIRIQKSLDATNYVKSTRYITKEKAASELEEMLGEDFISFLGYNPLLPSIEVNLFAAYANSDSILIIEADIGEFSHVQEVYYQESLIHLVNENVRKISIFLVAFSFLLFLVSISVINNTIRLSVYSRRFIINTMQLVGATNAFVRKPFLLKSIFHGFYAAIFANILMLGVIYMAHKEFSEFSGFQDLQTIGFLFLSIVLLGIILNLISTFFAVTRFLNLKTDELYY
jgi:cell division transport system permease protein